MVANAPGKLLKHRIYTDDYAAYLRYQATSRTLDGLNDDALDSCGAGLGQTIEEIELTRRAWERQAREAELDNVQRALSRQREGLELLVTRGGQVERTSNEACSPLEAERIAASGYRPTPEQKFTVYHVRLP